jgi:uncharacterized protein YecT (DUF1311 family)
MVGWVLVASLLMAASGPSGAAGSAACGPHQVPWRGGCFDRYQWDTDEKTCPDGVIVVPEGEDSPRCAPCEGYAGMQQPMNYCAGLRASKTDAALKETLEDVVKRFPDRERELRTGENTWLKSRDKVCRAKAKEFEGGSMAAEVLEDCLYQRNRKRIAELEAMMPPSTAGASTVLTCGGDPTKRTPVDRRASVRVTKSRLYAEAKACPSEGECPWLRKGYLVRGDQVSETAISGEFACVTFKASTGWLPSRDLCEEGATCSPDAPSRSEQPSKKAAVPFKDFCERARRSRTSDVATLDLLEQMFGVDGCPQLEARLSDLTEFSPIGQLYGAASQLSSLTPLSYAPKLQRIELPYGTPISDLTPLSNLTELTSLRMSASKVKDLSPLAGLKKLRFLDVRTSKVTDISPIIDLPNLTNVDLRNLRVPKSQRDALAAKHPKLDALF